MKLFAIAQRKGVGESGDRARNHLQPGKKALRHGRPLLSRAMSDWLFAAGRSKGKHCSSKRTGGGFQEVQSQAQREEARHRGEEGVPGARVRQVQNHGLRVQGAGGAAPGDRPQRVAGQQHHDVLSPREPAVQHHLGVLHGGGVPDHGRVQHYYWYDERGKKVKCTAPQYVDFVMSSVQKLVTDEDVFPTKYGREFPSSFEALVKKICKYLFHVLAHIYSAHFKETLALELHGHLNTLYAHFILFAREFNLLDPKETAVMDDLTEALCGGGGGDGPGGAAGAQNHVKER
ncbi:MOB kinase activator 2 isoform X1 [Bubalus bubalis]|uniref:MOB kinase activator 2 isoform X1 n=1 Tax=Bubalus bubalis TaxID=89462 RepID=UPI000DBC5904|nr:MOB kinase activator 2 isoform X1 [Bubalus bubalis]XP_045021809.1 MOB kinase activator 2 isoform X1 [Bubalus bubalis]